MDINAIREYLKLLMEALAEHTTGAEIQETDEGPVLLCSVSSPFEDEEDIGFRFEVTPLDDGLFVIEIMIVLFGGIDGKLLPGVETIIARLNPNCDIGSFKTLDEGGFVYYTQGMIFDEELDAALITETLGNTVTIMENNVQSMGGLIYRYLKGEELDIILDEAGRIE